MLEQSRQIQSQKSLLQRRKSLTTTLQSMIDGIIVLAAAYYFLFYFQGFISTLDAIFLVTLLVTMGVTYDQMGIYRQYRGLLNSARKLLFAWSISFAITIFLFVLVNYFDQISRSALMAIFTIAFAGQTLNRSLLLYFRGRSLQSVSEAAPVLLVGDGNLTRHLYDKINNNPWLEERALGRIQICDRQDDISVPILGQRGDIVEVVRRYKIRRVYTSVSLANSHLVEGIYYDLINENVDIHWAPNIFSMELVNHSVKEIAGIPLLTLSESPLIGNHRLLKAVEDKLIASICLILLSPLMLMIAMLIKLDSKGSVIFRQSRTGWDGGKFYIWKFRSMKPHDITDGVVKQATSDDDRFTRIGKLIRKSSIDELPQLFNVLTGQMSMVGPRPHAIEHNEEYSQRINAYMARHRIKPGITGLAQIHGYRGETDTLDKMERRVEYDMQYINNWSIWLDIGVILKTIPSLIRNKAY